MAGASAARAGVSSRGAASIDDMIMQCLEKAALALQASLPWRRPGGLAWRSGAGTPPASARAGMLSIVEFGRVLGRLEDLWIVPVEDLRVIGVAHQPNALIAAIGVARTNRPRNRRDEVLVEVFLEI